MFSGSLLVKKKKKKRVKIFLSVIVLEFLKKKIFFSFFVACIEHLGENAIKLTMFLLLHVNIKSHDELMSLSLCRDPHHHLPTVIVTPPPLLVYSLPLPLSSPYCYLLNIH